MIKQQQKLKGRISKFQETDKRSFILGSVIATIIATSPYLFYLFESVPSEPIWDTFLFTYESGYYENAQIAMWTLTGKAIPLYFLVIWFLTCRHWWYHVLLIPITMYLFQIVDIFNADLTYVDEFQFKYLIFVMAIVIPSIYLIRARIFNRINTVDKSTQELEDELRVKPKGLWAVIRQYF